MKRYCPVCKKDISDEHKNKQFCSVKCRYIKNQENRVKKSIEKYKNNPEIPTCLICGYKGNALNAHISKAHKMTVFEYKEKFNVDDSKIYSKKYLKKLSNNMQGDKNPGYQHGGKLSPFSKDFIGYKNLNEEETKNKIHKMATDCQQKSKENGNLAVTKEYYIKRGMSEEEAIEALKERQTTFSKDICIEKYGKEKGIEIWKDRQKKWIKNYKKSNFSKISQELFWQLYNEIKNDFKEIYFAELNNKNKDLSGKNNEYILSLNDCVIKPDFFIKDNNKIIEFDGDYWHGEKRGNQKRDLERQQLLEQEGFIIYRVLERDFNNNPKEIINKCKQFIYE